jgi:uncharacterized membrane protein (UPF0127 family)
VKLARRALFGIGVMVCILIALALLWSAGVSARAPTVVAHVAHQNGHAANNYTVFYASTPEERDEGLMNFTNFDSAGIVGEYFAFNSTNSQQQCFWMKDTPIPLVQAWLSENGTVSFIYNGTPESTQSVCEGGAAVLELDSNLRIPLSVGDVVSVYRG